MGQTETGIGFQFLIEAVIICSVGGAIGIGFSILAVKIVPAWPAVISLEWMLISVSFSVVIGISFGMYPAIKASSFPPIEALRTE